MPALSAERPSTTRRSDHLGKQRYLCATCPTPRRAAYTARQGAEVQRVYLITQIDRASRCIIASDVASDVASDREPERLQALLNTAPTAAQYYSGQLVTFGCTWVNTL